MRIFFKEYFDTFALLLACCCLNSYSDISASFGSVFFLQSINSRGFSLTTVIGQVVGTTVLSCPNCRICWLILTWKSIFVGPTMAALVQVNLSYDPPTLI